MGSDSKYLEKRFEERLKARYRKMMKEHDEEKKQPEYIRKKADDKVKADLNSARDKTIYGKRLRDVDAKPDPRASKVDVHRWADGAAFHDMSELKKRNKRKR